jgi:hypothetical protein
MEYLSNLKLFPTHAVCVTLLVRKSIFFCFSRHIVHECAAMVKYKCGQDVGCHLPEFLIKSNSSANHKTKKAVKLEPTASYVLIHYF